MDKLREPIRMFYNGMKLFEKQDKPMDVGGRAIILKACERKHTKEAKQHSYMRRTYSGGYITRDMEKRQMYLSDFDQLGARWVKDCQEVYAHFGHNGWFTDDHEFGTLIGVVLCFTRHGISDECGNYGGNVSDKPKGRVIYMAGTRHSDWDGVTLDLDTTDDPVTAARWADSMAEREAESCREEDEKYQAEQQAAELQEQIMNIRTRCLKLLRDMRPIRKGMHGIPESICDTLRTAVRGYIEEIATLRGELGELT
jgi:hypothetical protein